MGLDQVKKSPSASRTSPSAPRRTKTSTKNLETKTVDVLQSIIKTRKAWKTIKGGEVVWPPELESALLEGLAKYRPDDSRETRLLGRFPMRNRFISDHIFEVTGIRRTAKQVGSRLQQLRDTYQNTDLMKLLLPLGPVSASARRRMSTSACSNSSSSSDSSPPSSPQTPLDDFSSFPQQTTIHIDILDPKASPLDEPMALPMVGDENVIRTSPKARPISQIDPTVTFIAPNSVSALSTYAVYNGTELAFSETTELASCGPAPNGSAGKCLYRTTIVPGFWKSIVESSDPTQYTIVQEVYPADGPSDAPTIFSAVYKFNYPPSAADFIDAAFSDSGLDAAESSSPVDPLSTLPLDELITMDPSPYDDVYETYCDLLALSDRSWTSSPSQASVDFSWGYSERAVSTGPSMSPPPTSYSPLLSEYVNTDICGMP